MNSAIDLDPWVGTPTLWEILDPPLYCKRTFVLFKLVYNRIVCNEMTLIDCTMALRSIHTSNLCAHLVQYNPLLNDDLT